MAMHPFVHIDFAADDVDRLAKFYHELFEWEIDRDTYPGYVLLCPVPGQFAEDGLTGGIAKRESPGQHVVNFVLVESIDDYTAKAETLGAIVLESKAAIPTVGWRSVILDTEGNTIGMFQPDENAG